MGLEIYNIVKIKKENAPKCNESGKKRWKI